MDNTSKDSLEQLNKDILVSIADDCMTAYICLKNPGTEICYGYEDVKKALADAGVKWESVMNLSTEFYRKKI